MNISTEHILQCNQLEPLASVMSENASDQLWPQGSFLV